VKQKDLILENPKIPGRLPCDVQLTVHFEVKRSKAKVNNENMFEQKPFLFDINTARNKLNKLKTDKSAASYGMTKSLC